VSTTVVTPVRLGSDRLLPALFLESIGTPAVQTADRSTVLQWPRPCEIKSSESSRDWIKSSESSAVGNSVVLPTLAPHITSQSSHVRQLCEGVQAVDGSPATASGLVQSSASFNWILPIVGGSPLGVSPKTEDHSPGENMYGLFFDSPLPGQEGYHECLAKAYAQLEAVAVIDGATTDSLMSKAKCHGGVMPALPFLERVLKRGSPAPLFTELKIVDLPPHVITIAFEFLGAHELASCATLCSDWADHDDPIGAVLCSEHLWHAACIYRWATKPGWQEGHEALLRSTAGACRMSWRTLFGLAEQDGRRPRLSSDELTSVRWARCEAPMGHLLPNGPWWSTCQRVMFAMGHARPCGASVGVVYNVWRLPSWEWLLVAGLEDAFISRNSTGEFHTDGGMLTPTSLSPSSSLGSPPQWR